MPAVAYLRRSRVDTRRDGAISHEQQTTAIRALAERHGDNPDELVWIEDWGKSGRASKQHLRAGFARLEEMLEAGQVSAIYAYSTNRLARSLETLNRLAKRCAGIDPDTKERIPGAPLVPIRVHDGQSPDITDANGRLVFNILGSVAEWQADWTQERMQEATAVRRARGDHMGPAPYGYQVIDGRLVDRPGENLAAVIEAYMAEGSFQAAARRLTLAGVPTRKGGAWQASTVRDMLQDRAPEVLPPATSRPRVRSSFRLSGLLRCPHDGAMLTGRTYRGRWVAYGCRRAAADPSHPYPREVAEDRVLPWVVDEIGHLQAPDQVAGDPDAEARRPALEARRERVTEAFLDGTIDKTRRDRELLAIADELEHLSDRAQILDVPSIDWSWPASELNAILRAVLERVELGPDLLPKAATWRIPEWRAA